jgi:lysophospholipase L1-like esterase
MARRQRALVVAVAALLAGGCAMTPAPSAPPGALRYVALGDSYTIGTSEAEAARWPSQLVARLGPMPPTLELVANLGVNGRTSGDVIRDQLPQLDALSPDFVSLLIGVNDVVQGVPLERYRANMGTIFDALLARLPADRIVTVSTPDYTVTPAGADYGDPAVQSAAIRAVNDSLGELATARGIAFVDIYDLSLRAANDASLVADDGLHPSGAQYALWVERIATAVAALIGRSGP